MASLTVMTGTDALAVQIVYTASNGNVTGVTCANQGDEPVGVRVELANGQIAERVFDPQTTTTLSVPGRTIKVTFASDGEPTIAGIARMTVMVPA